MAEQRFDVTIDDGRKFAVIRGGRRWTKIPEYMSNGQLTARFFVDEVTREVRSAEGYNRPGRPMYGDAAAFVERVLAAADRVAAAAVPVAA